MLTLLGPPIPSLYKIQIILSPKRVSSGEGVNVMSAQHRNFPQNIPGINSYFFAHPLYYLRSFLSPSPSLDVTQIDPGGVTERSLLPPPHYGMRLHSYRGNNVTLSLSPRRLAYVFLRSKCPVLLY